MESVLDFVQQLAKLQNAQYFPSKKPVFPWLMSSRHSAQLWPEELLAKLCYSNDYDTLAFVLLNTSDVYTIQVCFERTEYLTEYEISALAGIVGMLHRYKPAILVRIVAIVPWTFSIFERLTCEQSQLDFLRYAKDEKDVFKVWLQWCRTDMCVNTNVTPKIKSQAVAKMQAIEDAGEKERQIYSWEIWRDIAQECDGLMD